VHQLAHTRNVAATELRCGTTRTDERDVHQTFVGRVRTWYRRRTCRWRRRQRAARRPVRKRFRRRTGTGPRGNRSHNDDPVDVRHGRGNDHTAVRAAKFDGTGAGDDVRARHDVCARDHSIGHLPDSGPDDNGSHDDVTAGDHNNDCDNHDDDNDDHDDRRTRKPAEHTRFEGRSVTAAPTKVRAHWIALAASMITLAVSLLLHGYTTNSIGATTANSDTSPGVPALYDLGPMIDIGDGTITSLTAPDRTVVITFDDGPDPQWTPQILDVLARHDVKATFFTTGSRVAAHPDIVRRIVADGHDIGNHTFTHADLAAVPPWRARVEMRLTQVALAAAAGRHTVLTRPPYSSEPSAVRRDTLHAWKNIAADGYLFVLSDIDTKDWRADATAASIAARAVPADGSGGIVLMHDSGGDRSETVAALDTIIVTLRGDGYTFVTASELAGLPRDQVMPAVSGATRIQSYALPIVLRVGSLFAYLFTILSVLIAAISAVRAAMLVWLARHHAATLKAHDPAFTPTVTIVVPAYNEAAGIEAAVTSLASNRYPYFEVIVIDDGSTDDTAERTAALIAQQRWSHVRLIRQMNGGKPAALNTGIAAARGDIIVTVDGDTVFDPDALAALVQPFSDPAVGAASGNTKVANRGGLIGRWQHLEYVIGFNLDRRFQDLAGCMPTVPGAIGAFRRDALASVGGVSNDTLAEDTDLTMAMHRAGWSVAYEPRAVAWTEAPGRLSDLWKQRYRWSYGTLQAVWKHRHAVVERGASGRLGRIGLPYLVVFQVALTLVAPVVDVFTLYGLLFLDVRVMAAYWLTFTALQICIAGYALHLDGEPKRDLWVLPLQQIVYRQLMYLVVIQSLVTIAAGARTGWHKLRRVGVTGPATHSRA
jgi:poly-beta-1,6 N-acetyl-D-glucosamine synthase